MLIALEFKNGASAHNLSTGGNSGARDKLVYAEVPQRVEFLLQSLSPFGRVFGRHRFSICSWIIGHFMLEVVRHGCEDVSEVSKLLLRKYCRQSIFVK
jgi:hypothetical protein